MSSSSSLLCQFLLISVVAIGTLLMIVRDVHALECYSSVTENANSARAGNENENPLMVSIDNGTQQCAAEAVYCAIYHCAKLLDDLTVRACLNVLDPKDAAEFCDDLGDYCAGDPKFQCGLCTTDKCNDY